MSQISFSYENPLKKRFSEEYFKNLPTSAGVYVFLGSRKTPLYIGKADSLKNRLMSYRTAKPGRVADHTLEMLELVKDIRWEEHVDGKAALEREKELIRILRPPFNIAGTDGAPYLYLGIRPLQVNSRDKSLRHVDFRLSHQELGEPFQLYGCFPDRGKVKKGYSALLRLFYASVCQRERFHLPAKICRTSPLYVYRGMVPIGWETYLDRYLKGEGADLLRVITKRLLENDNLPKYLYAPLQRDLVMAKEFFEFGPRRTRDIIRRHGVKSVVISQQRMDSLLRRKLILEVSEFTTHRN